MSYFIHVNFGDWVVALVSKGDFLPAACALFLVWIQFSLNSAGFIVLRYLHTNSRLPSFRHSKDFDHLIEIPRSSCLGYNPSKLLVCGRSKVIAVGIPVGPDVDQAHNADVQIATKLSSSCQPRLTSVPITSGPTNRFAKPSAWQAPEIHFVRENAQKQPTQTIVGKRRAGQEDVSHCLLGNYFGIVGSAGRTISR